MNTPRYGNAELFTLPPSRPARPPCRPAEHDGRVYPRVLPRLGQSGRLGSGLREEPRPAVPARPVLDRAAGLSRFADPYDPDVPPAPPDDQATEALSPVPQWPDNRLLVAGRGNRLPRHARSLARDQKATPASTAPERSTRGVPVPEPAPERTIEPPNPPPANGPASPFQQPPAPVPSVSTPPAPSPSNSGTNPTGNDAYSVPGHDLGEPDSDRRPVQRDSFRTGPRGQARRLPGNRPPDAGPRRRPPTRTGRGRRPRPPDTPRRHGPRPDQPRPVRPVQPRPDLTPEEYRASEAMGAEMAGILVPEAIDFNEAEAAACPPRPSPTSSHSNRRSCSR